MNILIIGLGSIAKRHISNLRGLLGDELNITVLRSGKGKSLTGAVREIINRVCITYDELEVHYDAVFITNPSSLHYDTLKN